MDNPGTYAFVLVFGFILTLLVGQLLIRAGKAFLEDIFGDARTASSISRLLGVLFYLITLGLLALLSIADLPTDNAVTTIIAKLGVVLLVLGVAHGTTMYALAQVRRRRREQKVASELHQQVELARVHHQEAREHDEHQHHDHHHDGHGEQSNQPPPVSGGPSVR